MGIIKHALKSFSKYPTDQYIVNYLNFQIQGSYDNNPNNKLVKNLLIFKESGKDYYHMSKGKREEREQDFNQDYPMENDSAYPKNKVPHIKYYHANNEHRIVHKINKLIFNEWPSRKERLKNIYIDSTYVTNIDIIIYKSKCNYYVSHEDFYQELCLLFQYILENLIQLIPKKNQKHILIYQIYLSSIFQRLYGEISKLKIEDQFSEDIERLFSINQLPKVKYSNDIIPTKKDFITINDYCKKAYNRYYQIAENRLQNKVD